MSEVHLDDLAASLLMRIIGQSPARELVGAILPNGTYELGKNILSEDHDVSGEIPGNSIAFAHNHPGGRDRLKGFSAQDVATADQVQRTSYIGMPSGEIRRYDPGFTDTYRDARDGKVRSHGDEVLAQFPIEEWRSHIMRTLLGRSPDDPRGAYR